MENFIANNTDVIAAVAAGVIAVNMILSGVQKLLEIVKDKTATNVDNKAAAFLASATGMLQKLIDWASANRPHK
jgi:hypothetical protein